MIGEPKTAVDYALDAALVAILIAGLLLIVGCGATGAALWSRDGACVPLCRNSNPSASNGAAMYDRAAEQCLCSWASDVGRPDQKSRVIDLTIDLNTMTCRDPSRVGREKSTTVEVTR